MRLVVLLTIAVAIQVECQFWPSPKEFLHNFSWFRQGKMNSETEVTTAPTYTLTNDQQTTLVGTPTMLARRKSTNVTTKVTTSATTTPKRTTPKQSPLTTTTTTLNDIQTIPTMTGTVTKKIVSQPTTTTSSTFTTSDRFTDMTATATTEDESVTVESRDNPRVHQYFPNKREKPQVKIAANISQNLLPLPAGAGAALVKPTKYHYYPHNQHIYLLPECAIQQVCNAVYIRLNWTQPLCACPSRYRDPCSASLNSDDLHTTELITEPSVKRALTLVKTCEPTADMRLCRTPRDWSLLALQNIRTGKSHYLVICRCPDTSILEGPMSHDQPTYASVPGIRVYGMMCVNDNRRGRRMARSTFDMPAFPWEKVTELANSANWD